MNVKICDCGRTVWQSDKRCECGRAYEDITSKQEPIKGAYERYLQHEFVTDTEIDAWFTRWEEKYKKGKND